MRARLFGFLALAAFMAWPAVSPAQFPGMGGGGGGFDISKLDPNFLFNMLGKGKDSVSRDELDDRSQKMFDRFAPMMGITGNTISREQFTQGFAKVSEMAKSGQLPGIPGGAALPGGPALPGGMGRGPGGDDQARIDRIAQDAFNRYDKNQDGLIQIDELPEDHALRNEREKYDTNSDGAYTLEEFKVYVAARMSGGSGGMTPGGPTPMRPPQDDNPDRRPIVLRASNLPKDLPSWFAELDRNGDRDGQVGLYEWKEAGKKISEYVAMDLNGDGYLTVEEYYRWKKQSDADARKSGESAGDQYARGGDRPGRGGFPGGGFPGAAPGTGEQAAPFGGGMRGAGGGTPGGFPGTRGSGGSTPGGFPGMSGMRVPGGDRSKGGEDRPKAEDDRTKKEDKGDRGGKGGPGGPGGGKGGPGGGRSVGRPGG